MTNTKTESVKLRTDVIKLVRDEKAKTGVTISRFIEDAILEKLDYNPVLFRNKNKTQTWKLNMYPWWLCYSRYVKNIKTPVNLDWLPFLKLKYMKKQHVLLILIAVFLIGYLTSCSRSICPPKGMKQGYSTGKSHL